MGGGVVEVGVEAGGLESTGPDSPGLASKRKSGSGKPRLAARSDLHALGVVLAGLSADTSSDAGCGTRYTE